MTLLEEAWLNEPVFSNIGTHLRCTIQNLSFLQKISGRKVVYEYLLHFRGESI